MAFVVNRNLNTGVNKFANIDSNSLPEDFLKQRILGLSAGHMKSNTAMLTATQASDMKLKDKESQLYHYQNHQRDVDCLLRVHQSDR